MQYLQWSCLQQFFILRGRLNRLSYFFQGLAITIIYLVFAVGLGIVFFYSDLISQFDLEQLSSFPLFPLHSLDSYITLLFYILFDIFLYCSFVLGYKRMQDLGMPGIGYAVFVVLGFVVEMFRSIYPNEGIDMLGMFWNFLLFCLGLLLLFARGTTGPNEYGPDPLLK